MKIHLGVLDVPHDDKLSTGDLADILEDKYGVMENFAALHMRDIAEAISISYSEAAQALAMGAPATLNGFAAAAADIKKAFSFYLENEEIALTGEPGVPTAAAQMGVNHRLKLRRGAARPSFIDTGLYQASFQAWAK